MLRPYKNPPNFTWSSITTAPSMINPKSCRTRYICSTNVPIFQEHQAATQRPRSSKTAEEGAQILRQQLRLFERGEMPAARHLRPVLDVDGAFAPFARWRANVFREGRHPGWHF